MITTPEPVARQRIDGLLQSAGWALQDRADFNRSAGLGVAVREFQLPSGPCDYLLFVDGKAAGVIEAKKAGVTLSGVAEQSERYMAALPEHLARWDKMLRYDYESTGDETFFRDMRDPAPRSRRVFAFHRPEALREWLQQPDTLRGRVRSLPALDPAGLRDCQVEAIIGLERSLAEDRPRSLIQLATGAGSEPDEVPPVEYNPDAPIETFDFIVNDECHRSIYGLWRQVLEYFDASIIGLTATPSKHTLGFFNQNLVAEYPYERSVADGVNVGHEIYRIRTRVGEKGGRLQPTDFVYKINRTNIHKQRCASSVRNKTCREVTPGGAPRTRFPATRECRSSQPDSAARRCQCRAGAI